MPQDSTARDDDDAGLEVALPHRRVTANMLVSYNLGYFRRKAGLTQKQLGAALGGWSEASVSVAERGWDGRRIRKFDADEVTRIAVVLGIPVIALLLPPEDAGTAVDYLFDVGADRLVILEGMLRQVLPRYAGDTDVMAAFQQRLMALGVIWHDPPGAEGLAERILRGAFAQAGRIEAGALAQAKQVTDDARARAEALEREAEDRYISGRLDPAMDQADQAMADVIAVVRHEAEEALGRARREANDILTEARSQFEQITSDARARAESLERDAQKRHGQAMGSLVQSREELERRVDDLRAFERTYRVRLIRYHDEALRELRGEAEAEGRAEAEGGEQQ